MDLRHVSLVNIQACILLGTLCFTDGDTGSEAVYYSAANRMALVLGLPDRETHSELEHQIQLRGMSIHSSVLNDTDKSSLVVALHD